MTDTAAPTNCKNDPALDGFVGYADLVLELCLLSQSEAGGDGVPIAALLIDNATGKVLGRGHNCLVQLSNPIYHGEMSAIANAGRMENRFNTTLYTSLAPCTMCAGAIVMFGIPRVVVLDNVSSPGEIEFLRSRGVEVVVRNDERIVKMCEEYKTKRPDLWKEDWGGKTA